MITIFEKSKGGVSAIEILKLDVPDTGRIPKELERDFLELPEVSEIEVIRHYIQLSRRNFGVDLGFYPLGSCTMKYSPKINEEIANFEGFSGLHPYVPLSFSQGSLKLMYGLSSFLKEISGMDAVSLQPAAGAHGELTGIMIMKVYFEKKQEKRTKIMIPDSAHGTNPATVTMCGFTCMQVKSSSKGSLDIDDLKAKIDSDTVGLMLTNPNTLGIFDENILEIIKIVHDNGSLVYCDGANLNANMGIVRVGDLGFDMIHFNLHKTFSTPHGCGGPGSGPLGVKEYLAEFLPNPTIIEEKNGGRESYKLDYSKNSIGKVKAFYGNFTVLVKAYAYIMGLGAEGIKNAAENAVLNANYMMSKLKKHYNLPYDRICQHEFVIDDSRMENNVTTNDIAKRLLDYGFHAPTVYFPLIVKGAMMIEPTETESKETLDRFCDVMIKIKEESKTDQDKVKNAPWKMPVKRVDAVKAARELDVVFNK
ncbi:MAG: aminomethyl-transferring glycine dehydrogenase subunit GcvPB [Candidatus Woesearchaeota archaeon]|nr:aminomethyl-transferring glycine dehydrogenase subunit GcvPB [Candidatus Woesearchaeota archaeon]